MIMNIVTDPDHKPLTAEFLSPLSTQGLTATDPTGETIAAFSYSPDPLKQGFYIRRTQLEGTVLINNVPPLTSVLVDGTTITGDGATVALSATGTGPGLEWITCTEDPDLTTISSDLEIIGGISSGEYTISATTDSNHCDLLSFKAHGQDILVLSSEADDTIDQIINIRANVIYLGDTTDQTTTGRVIICRYVIEAPQGLSVGSPESHSSIGLNGEVINSWSDLSAYVPGAGGATLDEVQADIVSRGIFLGNLTYDGSDPYTPQILMNNQLAISANMSAWTVEAGQLKLNIPDSDDNYFEINPTNDGINYHLMIGASLAGGILDVGVDGPDTETAGQATLTVHGDLILHNGRTLTLYAEPITRWSDLSLYIPGMSLPYISCTDGDPNMTTISSALAVSGDSKFNGLVTMSSNSILIFNPIPEGSGGGTDWRVYNESGAFRIKDSTQEDILLNLVTSDDPRLWIRGSGLFHGRVEIGYGYEPAPLMLHGPLILGFATPLPSPSDSDPFTLEALLVDNPDAGHMEDLILTNHQLGEIIRINTIASFGAGTIRCPVLGIECSDITANGLATNYINLSGQTINSWAEIFGPDWSAKEDDDKNLVISYKRGDVLRSE
jgi:hypothetical protein